MNPVRLKAIKPPRPRDKTPFPSKLISFEGIDGCGKSTLMEQLASWLAKAGIPHVLTREPGGTPIGEKIRDLLLDPSSAGMNARTEVLLYSASRAQLTAGVILPAIKKGTWVLTDRYIDATLAYQGFGRGLDVEGLRALQEWATRGLWPDKTILLDCGVDLALARMQERNHTADRIEQENREFHEKVRDGYLELARIEPDRFIVLDAARPLEEVISEFFEAFWMAEVEHHVRRG